MSDTNSVICIGELLIDFFCTDVDVDLTEGEHFLKQAGGAPANVSAAIAKLGGKSSFVGKVGDDQFGFFLEKTLKNANVDTTMLLKDATTMTTLAFVSLQSNGERDFIFKRGADENLTLSELDVEAIMAASALHFGSATAMLGGDSFQTYFSLMDIANERNSFVSFDPNYRDNLWEGQQQQFIERARKGIRKADFVKVSDEELMLISDMEDLHKGVDVLHQLGAQIIAVTLGKEGTLLSTRENRIVVPSVQVKSIDSTGAGDAFVGATLYQIAQLDDPKQLANDFEQLQTIIRFSNKVGALVCTKIGAISSLPTYEEVLDFEGK